VTDYSPVYAEPSAAPAPKARLAERLPAPPTVGDEQSTGSVVRWRRDVHGERREGGRAREERRVSKYARGVHARKRRRPAAPPARLP
tara:strand:+ start:458 stop:718 length:261 start_codon:yes stop_codon:yes gene_type:complete